jgi:hypothetical protein
MPEYDQTLYAQVLLGDEADKFFESDLGRYILGRAQQEAQEAMNELKDVEPTEPAAVMRLQNRVKIAEAVPMYLNELIIEGRQALAILDEREE